MTTRTSPPLSVWQMDPTLGANASGALHGVLAVSPDEMWAVGKLVPEFDEHGGALVVRWTPEPELIAPAPVALPLNVQLHAVAWAADQVWAVGEIAGDGGDRSPRIERYSRLSEPAVAVDAPEVDGDSALYGVAMLPAGEGWAVGGAGPGAGAAYTRTLTVRWNGSSWQTVPSPSPGTLANQLRAVAAISTDDVWAVGYSSILPGRTDALILHWDGSAWTALPTPPQATDGELVGIAVVSPSSVWAVGATTRTDSGQPVGLILHWNGVDWRSVPVPPFVTHISGVTVLAPNDVLFSGYSTVDGPETALVAHWDGEQLRVEVATVTTEDPGINSNVGTALNGICAAGDRGVAVGWRQADPAKRPAAFYRSAVTIS